MRGRLRFVAAGASLALAAGAATAAFATALHAGPQGDGTAITPNGWIVTPAGKQVDLMDGAPVWADRPFSEVLSPDGRWLRIGSDGQSTQSLKVVDTTTGKVTQTIPYTGDEALFVGLAFSPDGRHAYASAGGNNKVRVYDVTNGILAKKRPIPVPGFPAGLSISADGSTLYVAENRRDALGVIDLKTTAVTNEHTRGTDPGYPTPKQYVADNDYALGKLVDTVSHSKFWSSTAIFVVEDDAQDGPDHVDAHRTEALVISQFTQTGKVDSTLYSTVSMLRTMELIVGLQPLTQFDAAATPMLNSFSSKANRKTYCAGLPRELAPCTAAGSQTTTGNTEKSPLAAESAAMNFDSADAPNNRVLNQAIWQSVKGDGNPMPEPTNATMSAPRDTDG